MNKILSTLLFSTAATAALAAQTGSKVLPEYNGWLSGNTSATVPFTYDSFRWQQIIHASEITQNSATITSMALRPDYASATALSVPNVTVRLSHTSVAPAMMGHSFASNLGTQPVTVFSGTVQLPAQSAPPIGPMPFTVSIPFSTPFQYTPSQGHLLIDVVANNSAPANRIRWGADAWLPGGTREYFGQRGPGVDNLGFTAFGSRGVLRDGLIPGGGIDIMTSMASWLPDYGGATLLGLSTQTNPIDLTSMGAPGSSLYIDNVVTGIPHSWQGSFTAKNSIVGILIPNDPNLLGADIYSQSALVVPSANALGLVMTEAMRLAIGDPTYVGMQMISVNDPTAAQGAPLQANSVGGLVLTLNGTFR